MASCSFGRCRSASVWSSPLLCKEHFLVAFEEKVAATITEFTLLKRNDKVAVACSGGKDSTALLFLLHKLGYDVTALAVDEGIAGYRDRTLRDLKKFCSANKIPLKTVSFKTGFGSTLDHILSTKDVLPCSVCGTFRRTLLQQHAKGFDVIATGHNADDEAQAVLMNLARANLDLFPRGGPVTRSDASGFVRRVKPLYFCTEKECLTYALLRGLATEWNECPYAGRAYRNDAREALNAYEQAHPGAKVRVLRHYLMVRGPAARSRAVSCVRCGEPSARGLCKACRLVEAVL